MFPYFYHGKNKHHEEKQKENLCVMATMYVHGNISASPLPGPPFSLLPLIGILPSPILYNITRSGNISFCFFFLPFYLAAGSGQGDGGETQPYHGKPLKKKRNKRKKKNQQQPCHYHLAMHRPAACNSPSCAAPFCTSTSEAHTHTCHWWYTMYVCTHIALKGKFASLVIRISFFFWPRPPPPGGRGGGRRVPSRPVMYVCIVHTSTYISATG